MSKKLFIIINVDWFFLSHRKEIALEAIKKGFDLTIVTKDAGKKMKSNHWNVYTDFVI
jgi:hypothetical protein